MAILYLPKVHFTSFDAIAPFLVHLRVEGGRGIDVDMLVTSKATADNIAASPFHLQLMTACTRAWRLWGHRRVFSVLRRQAGFILLPLLRRLTHRRVVILTHSRDCTVELRRLQAMAGPSTDVVCFPSVQVPMTDAYVRRMEPGALSFFQKFGMRSRGTAQASIGKALTYFPSETPILRRYLFPSTELTPIGLPRLYSSWHAYLSEWGRKAFADEAKRIGISQDAQVVTVILTNKDYIWFDSETAYQEALIECLLCIRSHFPEIPVLLKCKALDIYRQQQDEVLDLVGGRFEGVYPTACGLCVLATRSVLALTINESSGAFDFITQGVPVLEYAIYNETWRESFPEGGAYSQTPGVYVANGPREFETAVKGIKEGTCVAPPRAESARFFGHAEPTREDLLQRVFGRLRNRGVPEMTDGGHSV